MKLFTNIPYTLFSQLAPSNHWLVPMHYRRCGKSCLRKSSKPLLFYKKWASPTVTLKPGNLTVDAYDRPQASVTPSVIDATGRNDAHEKHVQEKREELIVSYMFANAASATGEFCYTSP